MKKQILISNIYYQCLLWVCVLPTSSLYAESFDDFPPAARTVIELPAQKLFLDLIINSYSTGKLIPVVLFNNHYYVQKQLLLDQGINPDHFASVQAHNLDASTLFSLSLPPNLQDWVQLDGIADIKLNYETVNQKLLLDVPADWLPQQRLGRDYLYQREEIRSGFGILNNYDFYYFVPAEGESSFNIFLEQKVFSPYGSLRNSGALLQKNSNNSDLNTEYLRYDTNWQYDDDERVLSYQIGDLYSATKNAWGSSVRMGGIQIRKNFGTRPDLITHPLPQFSGETALPGTLDVFINGIKNSSTTIQPGPFVLNNVPFINGRGEAMLVTTDVLGRQISTTIPFYVSNALLKPKLVDYAFSLGKLRQNFGQNNFDYGELVGTLDTRYGLTNWLTLEGHGETSQDLLNMGVGGVVKLHHYGTLNGSYSDSKVKDSNLMGHQFTLGYQYQQPRFGINLSHTQRSKDYFTLARFYESSLDTVNASENNFANINFSTEKIGSFGLGYIHLKDHLTENKLMNFSWAPVLPSRLKGMTAAFSANKNLMTKDWNASLAFAFPLDFMHSRMSTGYNYNNSGLDTGYVNLNYIMPTQGGIGIDLTHQYLENGDGQNKANLSYRNAHFNLNTGLSGYKDYNYWIGLSGSIVWMKQQLFLAQQIGESFALIDTQGVGDIPIRYENSLLGRTNQQGHFLVPNISPFYAAKYSIDPLGLPANYSTLLVEQKIAARSGSGIVVNFPVKKSYSANVYLKQMNGEPVPAGSVVNREDKNSTFVGLDGIVYLEDIETENKITVDIGNGFTCIAEFKAELSNQTITTIPDVYCQ